MKKTFELTLDGKVARLMWGARQTGVFRMRRLSSLVLFPVTLAVILLLPSVDLDVRLILGTLLGGMVTLFVYFSTATIMAAQYRKLVVQSLGGPEPTEVEVEITADALVFRDDDKQVHLEWHSIKSVTTTNEGLEIHGDNMPLALIPPGIFNDEECQFWTQAINERIDACQAEARTSADSAEPAQC